MWEQPKGTTSPRVWKQLEMQVRRADPPPDDLKLATFHPSGWVREDALRRLADLPEAAPFFVRRLNDWVEPIRRRAEEWVGANLEACLPWLPLLASELARWRGPEPAWWPKLATRLQSNPALLAEAPWLLSRLLVLRPDARTVESWWPVLPTVWRQRLARHVLERPELSALEHLIVTDRAPQIRVLRVFPEMLWDRSARVREAAILLCRHLGQEAAEIYRAALGGERHEAALAGLAQCCQADPDLPLFVERLQAPFAWQRVQALEALRRMDAGQPEIRDMLWGDPSPRPRRVALGLLESELSAQEILRLCQDAMPSVARDARRILARRHTWHELRRILESRDSAGLNVWLLRFRRRSWLRPGHCLRGELAAAYRAASWLPPGVVGELSFLG